jgi:hypothetical protein
MKDILTKLAIDILLFMRLPLLMLLTAPLFAQGTLDTLISRPILDAHNCYPYKGQWSDRIERALKSGFPVGIEQDLAWDARGSRAVVSHAQEVTGQEPDLRTHFFERVRPIVEQALKENDRSRWPLIVVHFDFKTVTPPLLKAVWELLGEYEGWITTAAKSADSSVLTPFDVKPLLVLTEDSDAQEEAFYKALPVGGKMRLFGSAHTGALPSDTAQKNHLWATLPPEQLLPAPATTYRRWWNNSWYPVEQGGQARAGEWTPASAARLHALVDHAHRLGLWIRFYTLDGFAPAESRGWDASYNFGSREAVDARWKAAIQAGVDLIATDQYEDLAALMR